MTVLQFIEKQRRFIAALESQNTPLFLAASTVDAERIDRIFTQGRNSAGTRIGSYNNRTPLYVNPQDAPRGFPPRGKHGNTRFKNGRPHKTGYFSSYREFRQKQGRESRFVNLTLSGQLKNDLSNGLTRTGNGSYVSRPKYKSSRDKMLGATKRYGAIFNLTKEERSLFAQVAQYELKKAYDNA